MEKIYLLIGISVAGVFIIVFLKKYTPEYALAAAICFGCVVCLSVITELGTVFTSIKQWQQPESKEWLYSVGKICVICFFGQWGIQIARDAGENSIADKLEFAVKIMVLILCLPYIDMLFQLVSEL